MKEAITYDDVLLVPTYSTVTPDMVDVSTMLGAMKLDIPIVSAPMDTVTEKSMAEGMSKLGGLGIIHKNMDEMAQLSQVKTVVAGGHRVGVAVSPTKFKKDYIKKLVDSGVSTIVIDSAHGDSKNVIKAVEEVDFILSGLDVLIIAGNVATGLGAKRLVSAGADVVKVGIGPGSICTTRIVAGVGVPQLTAIVDVREEIKDTADIIADGGIRYSGDIAKALAAGASAVMLGSMLAGHDESPGFSFNVEDKKYKSYRGMGSEGAMNEGSADRYSQDGSEKFVPEGIEGSVLYKGKLEDTIYQLIGGLKSSMGYLGAGNLTSFKRNAEFVKVSPSALRENHPHNIHNMKESANYAN